MHFITYKNVPNKHNLGGSIVETYFSFCVCSLVVFFFLLKFVLAQGLLGSYLLNVMPDVPCWPCEQFDLMA